MVWTSKNYYKVCLELSVNQNHSMVKINTSTSKLGNQQLARIWNHFSKTKLILSKCRMEIIRKILILLLWNHGKLGILLVDNYFTAQHEIIFAVINSQFAGIELQFATISSQFSATCSQFAVIHLLFAVNNLQHVSNWRSVCGEMICIQNIRYRVRRPTITW